MPVQRRRFRGPVLLGLHRHRQHAQHALRSGQSGTGATATASETTGPAHRSPWESSRIASPAPATSHGPRHQSDTSRLLDRTRRRSRHPIRTKTPPSTNHRLHGRAHRDRATCATTFHRDRRRSSRRPTHLPIHARARHQRGTRLDQRSQPNVGGMEAQPTPRASWRHPGPTPRPTTPTPAGLLH